MSQFKCYVWTRTDKDDREKDPKQVSSSKHKKTTMIYRATVSENDLKLSITATSKDIKKELHVF